MSIFFPKFDITKRVILSVTQMRRGGRGWKTMTAEVTRLHLASRKSHGNVPKGAETQQREFLFTAVDSM